MKLLRKIKQRISNMKTIAALLSGAEQIANELGVEVAGAEHLLAAAIELPDGRAAEAFSGIGIDSQRYIGAITKQQESALLNVGLDVSGLDLQPDEIAAQKPSFPSAQESAKSVLRNMASNTRFNDAAPVTGVDVVLAVVEQKPAVAVAVLEVLGVDIDSLQQSALTVKRDTTA